MKRRVKRLVTFSLGLFFFVLLFNLFSLDCGLVRLLNGQRTSAQSGTYTFFNSQRGKAQSRRNSTFVVDLFRNNCARCHGADGRGDTPLGHTYQAPDFTDDQWWRKHANITRTTSLISIVSHGKGGMPAFGKKLRPGEIKLLVIYVRRFRKSI